MAGGKWDLRIDQLDNGLIVVFIPDAPGPRCGSIFYLTPEKVIVTNVQLAGTIKCPENLGAGSSEILRIIPGEELPEPQSVR